MASLVDVATGILFQSTRRVEVSAQNISNATTPGYKRHLSFSQVLSDVDGSLGWNSSVDFTPGKILNTGNPFDLALDGNEVFEVKSDEGEVFFTRQGQFKPDANGRLVTSQGYALQTDNGDLIVGDSPLQVLEDGTVLEGGQPSAKISIVTLSDPRAAQMAPNGLVASNAAVEPTARPAVHQGMLEASNVTTGDEMVAMMAALRQAGAAQRIVNIYDDLMGRALTAFSAAAAG